MSTADDERDDELEQPDEPDTDREGEPGDEELDEAEQPDEPEALAPVDDKPSDLAIVRALDREDTRHEKAVAKALGIEPGAMHRCPHCEGVGFTPQPLEAEPQLVQDPFTETCDRCKGNGSTLSGATRLGMYEIPCNGCSGSGYVQRAEQPTVGATGTNGETRVTIAPPPPQVAQGDAAAIADLKARGYTILDPIVVPEPVPA